jgi:preprotein translocase subunit SecY
MNNLMQKLGQVWRTKELRNKITFTLAMLAVFRLAAHVTIPGINIEQIRVLMEQQQGQGGLMSIFALLTGGAMENFSIVLMGLTPYINASIVMQLLGVIVPSLEELKKEGEAGQKKISQYTRILTIPLAFVQSYGMIAFLNRFGFGGQIVDTSSLEVMLPIMLTVTAGTVFLMWLGELISEKGLGNGISLLILAGIVATVPTQIASAMQAADGFVVIGIILAVLAMAFFVVYVSEADRRVPVVYASRKGGVGQQTFLPMKINQAGMIPIIFAVSLVSMPSVVAQFGADHSNVIISGLSNWLIENLNPSSPTLWYNAVYAALIFVFTFFYVSITFEPRKVAENIQKRGGYVPGYRPGNETENLFENISSRLCFWGAVFLTFVSIAPMFFESWISAGGTISLFISGASMIIIVSVILDIVRRVNAQLVMHDYDKL